MADGLTETVLKRRSAAKTGGFALVGVGLGLILKAAFGFEPADAFFSSVQAVTDWFSGVKALLDAHPGVRGWLLGPVAFGLLFWALSKVDWFRGGVLDRLFPDPPPFVRSDLDEARSRERMITLEGPPLPFVGRGAELAELEELFGEPEIPFRWRALTGPSGIGKTRLGIEWLEAGKARGWDVGILDRNDTGVLKDWRPRRGTALVVDEARREWDDVLGDLLASLAKTGIAGRPVRVLIIDQIEPFVDIRQGEDRDRVKAANLPSPIRLSGLDDADVAALQSASGRSRLDEAVLIRESVGRPRAALILLNARDAVSYIGAVAEWVERFVPGLGDGGTAIPASLAGPLFLSALAGSVDSDLTRELFGQVDAGLLMRFYQNESRASLEQRLPPLVPDVLAEELVLRLAPRLDTKLREAAVDRILAVSPAAVENRLAALWRARSEPGTAMVRRESEASLLWLQERFDRCLPERVRSLRSLALDRVAAMSEPELIPDRMWDMLAEIQDICAGRAFDAEFRTIEATALVNAAAQCDASPIDPGADILERLEACGRRLLQLLRSSSGEAAVAMMRAAMTFSTSAILAYGRARLFSPVETWGERLTQWSSEAQLADESETRVMLATGARAAVVQYAKVGQFEDVERWAAPLFAPTRTESAADEAKICAHRAAAAVGAIHSYGNARRFADLERWGKLLCNMADDERWSGFWDVRIQEARASTNAIGHYGAAGDFVALERWGRRLTVIGEDERFSARTELRVTQAGGAMNAIVYYGATRQYGAMQRWGQLLLDTTEDERFAAESSVREMEARGLSNIIGELSKGGRLEALSPWDERLFALADDCAHRTNRIIRQAEVNASIDVFRACGETGDLDRLSWWGKRVKAVAAEAELMNDPSTVATVAKASVSAYLAYMRCGKGDWPRAQEWRRQIAALARRWPAIATVQELANQFGLTAVAQGASTRSPS